MLLGTHTYKHLHTHMHIHTWGYFTYIMPSNNYDCNRNYARMLCDSAYDYTSQFMFLKSMSPSRAAGVKAGSGCTGGGAGLAPFPPPPQLPAEGRLGRRTEEGSRRPLDASDDCGQWHPCTGLGFPLCRRGQAHENPPCPRQPAPPRAPATSLSPRPARQFSPERLENCLAGYPR